MTGMSKDSTPSLVMDEKRIGSRLTATEMIGGVECRIVLEKDTSGQYREVLLTPVTTGPQPGHGRF